MIFNKEKIEDYYSIVWLRFHVRIYKEKEYNYCIKSNYGAITNHPVMKFIYDI